MPQHQSLHYFWFCCATRSIYSLLPSSSPSSHYSQCYSYSPPWRSGFSLVSFARSFSARCLLLILVTGTPSPRDRYSNISFAAFVYRVVAIPNKSRLPSVEPCVTRKKALKSPSNDFRHTDIRGSDGLGAGAIYHSIRSSTMIIRPSHCRHSPCRRVLIYFTILLQFAKQQYVIVHVVCIMHASRGVEIELLLRTWYSMFYVTTCCMHVDCVSCRFFSVFLRLFVFFYLVRIVLSYKFIHDYSGTAVTRSERLIICKTHTPQENMKTLLLYLREKSVVTFHSPSLSLLVVGVCLEKSIMNPH